MLEKAPNYTEAQTTELVAAYTDADSEESRENVIEEFAAKFAKSTRSVRQKLVREGVYIKKERAPAGKSPERKAAIVSDIAKALGVPTETIESLEKATKKSLELVRGTLQRMPQE